MTSHHAPRKAPPWMKVYPSRILGDMVVTSLSPRDFRAHVLMLCLAWENDGLPESASLFAQRVGQRSDALRSSLEDPDRLGALWHLDGSLRWRNTEQEQLRSEYLEKAETRRAAAKLGHAIKLGLLPPGSSIDDLVALELERGVP